MSSGVSDQMKVPVKNVEERSIPWSQQVDEASNENIASPNYDDNSAANSNAMQFQYPPFNAKDIQNSSSNNYKNRKAYNNFDNNKKHVKPIIYVNIKDDFQRNAWRRPINDNLPGSYNRNNKSDEGYISGNTHDNKQSNASSAISATLTTVPASATAAPKKTTWASVASQPAKLTSRTTLITSSHKKKGPGMPPPPMIPGKHDLDVNAWDLPNNNPPLVPSPPPPPPPPPPIDQSFAEVTLDRTHSINIDHYPNSNQNYSNASISGIRSSDKMIGRNCDYQKIDDNKSNYPNQHNNFGRHRTSPNGHSRKNWSTQHPLHQNRQMNSGTVIRRSDGGNNANSSGLGNSSGGLNRYGSGNERRGYSNSNSRLEQEHGFDFRDENLPRNNERTISIERLSGGTVTDSPQAVLDELKDKNNYNPMELDKDIATTARFFVIKSYSEDDIHRSIKYEIWCSTDHGNKRLDDAFKERQKEGGNILLFFSVNGSGHFCGMAQMMTAVDYNSTSSVWSQDKWRGKFKVKWIYVKDVPNGKFRHIRLENNENKMVTHSRDTQEVPNPQGKEVLDILHSYKHSTSIFDDFYHYEKKQEEEVSSKKPYDHPNSNAPYVTGMDRDGGRDRNTKYFHANTGGGGGGGGGGNSGTGTISASNGSNMGGGGGGGNTSNFRERNNHRSGGSASNNFHNNYNEYRRFENHRPIGSRERDTDNVRGERDGDSNEYNISRHIPKFDYNRRDERMKMKYNNRDRDISEEHNKSDTRYRTGTREIQKDNEHSSSFRIRGNTDY